MWRRTVVLLAAPLVVACGSSGHRPAPVLSGCAAGALHAGSGPIWASHSNPPSSTWYVVGAHQTATAFIFGFPLRAGHPGQTQNKILWILRAPGTALTIRATPLHATRPVVTATLHDSAGPETYPSYVNVPVAGCWHVNLRWAGHTDSVDLPYDPSCPVTPPGGPRPPRVALENFGQPMASASSPGWYGNGALWTELPPGLPANLAALRTTGPNGVPMIGIKMGWNRALPGAVTVAARPLHGPAAEFTAHVGTVQEYGRRGFVTSELLFGRPGCWRITARLGRHVLPLVVDIPSPEE